MKNKIRLLEQKILQLENERQQHLALFDNGEVALFKWNNDESWSTAYASQSTYKLFGYRPEEFVSNKIDYAEVIHPDDLNMIMNEVINALENDIEYFTHTAYRIITKNQTIKWVLDSTHMIKGEDGEVSHFLGTIADITELKNYELNLKNLVEEKIEENNKQKDILYRQSRLTTIGETIQNISHQWRQPLNHIGANISKLEMINEISLKNSDIQTIINNANNSLEYMSQTISDFTNYFSPNKVKEKFFIDEAILDAISIVKHQFNNLEINIVFNTTKKCAKINAHKNELIQAIIILLNNSKDALLLKKESISYKCLINIDIDVQDNILYLFIADNGIGIKKDLIESIFEPYFTTKFKQQGTGIGLYMCKMIIEKDMGGLIEASSSVDKTLFTIRLKI